MAPPAFAEPGAWASFRLGVEHSVLARGLFLLPWVFFALAVPLVPQRFEDVAAVFLACQLIGLGAWLGLDGTSRRMAFITGLGGSQVAREAGVMAFELTLFVGMALMGWLGAPEDYPTVEVGLLLGVFAYGVGGVTRLSGATLGGRGIRALGMTLVMGLSGVLAWLCGWMHLDDALALQAWLVCGLSAVARLLLASWSPESAAGRGRPRPIWLVCALASIFVLPLEALHDPSEVLRPDPSGHLLVPPSGDVLSPRHLWRVTADGDRERLPVKGPFYSALGHASGAAVYVRHDLVDMLWSSKERHEPIPITGLLTADGHSTECALPEGAYWTWFDPAGQSALVADDAGGVWRVDAAGCRLHDGVPSGLPDQLLAMNAKGRGFTPTDDWRVAGINGKTFRLVGAGK